LHKSRSNGLDVLRIEHVLDNYVSKKQLCGGLADTVPVRVGIRHVYFCILNSTLDLKLASLEARLSALSGAKFIITDQGIIPRLR